LGLLQHCHFTQRLRRCRYLQLIGQGDSCGISRSPQRDAWVDMLDMFYSHVSLPSRIETIRLYCNQSSHQTRRWWSRRGFSIFSALLLARLECFSASIILALKRRRRRGSLFQNLGSIHANVTVHMIPYGGTEVQGRSTRELESEASHKVNTPVRALSTLHSSSLGHLVCCHHPPSLRPTAQQWPFRSYCGTCVFCTARGITITA